MSRSRLAAAALLALAGIPVAVRGQAILHPNQITGSIRWSNTNPAVRALLDGRGTFPWTVSGTSIGLPTELRASVGGTETRGREVDRYELTVESSATGIPYHVLVAAREFNVSRYTFAQAESAPVLEEPAPDVTLNFIECAGLLRFSMPATITDGRIVAWRDGEGTYGNENDAQALRGVRAGMTAPELLVRGDDHLYHVRVRITFGTDGTLDTLTYERIFDVVVGCDQVVDIDCSGGATGLDPASLGRVFGNFDVVGEREIPDPGPNTRTIVSMSNGPWDNGRFARLLSDPASGPFTLPNIMPSTVVSPAQPYMLRAHSWLRGGPFMQDFTSPLLWVTVGEAEIIDLGDQLVLTPAYLEGDIQLAGPPRSGTFGSVLDHILLSGSTDPNWIPPWGSLSWSRVSVGMTESAFPGSVDPITEEFLGSHETVVTGLGAGPWWSGVGSLVLQMTHRLSPAEIDNDIDCRTFIQETDAGFVASPGDRIDFDRRYCMSQVNLAFLTTSGTFCDPAVQEISGSFDGRDFLGRDVEYNVDVYATGIPVSVGNADTTGRVTMGLPMGEYVLSPTFSAINPADGRISNVQVMPVPVTVGCRQIIDMYPEIGIQIGVDDVPPCAEAGVLPVSGSVRSEVDVVQITYSVSGGTPVIICTGCGISPPFSALIPIADSDNEIVIRAVDTVGRSASVTAFTQWAPEPSALDRRPGSPPLIVWRDATGSLVITWEARAAANVYRGSITALHETRDYDHAGIGACDLAAGTLTLPAGSGSFYFLAGGTCAWGDGSLGRDSFGRERPAARDRCP